MSSSISSQKLPHVERRGLFARKRLVSWANAVIFVFPVLITFTIIKIIPFATSFWYALTNWDGVATIIDFVGLANFKRLLADKQFWHSLEFTLKFALLAVILTNLIGFFLAYFLSKLIPGRNFMRACFYIPNTIGGLVLGFIWSFIFFVVIADIGTKTRLWPFALPWMGTPTTSFWALVLVESWRGSGFLMLLYVAGFTTVPNECIESATIDGASPLRILTRVTIPLMMPTITRCLFLSILGSMRIYELNLALTAGHPYRSSESITMDIFNTAFTANKLGYGTAKSLVFLVVVVAITGVQVYLTSRREVEM
jgi:raffinose/stachyose/melibiose transport system permease protein